MLTWSDIEKARKRLEGVAHRTPVLRSRQFDAEAGATVFFKAENLQRGGAFKFRGAYNKMKAESEKGKVEAVVAFSSGNHAQAVALVSRLLGIRATIVMPTDAPKAKIEATRGYGAEVVLYDRETQSRDDLAEQICREKGAILVPPFDDELVMAGAATGAVELLEEIRDIDALVVPVSGGGLIGGWATAGRHLRPEIRIYGVEPESADDTRRSLEAGSRVAVAKNPTVADGLRVTTPGKLTFPIVQETRGGDSPRVRRGDDRDADLDAGEDEGSDRAVRRGGGGGGAPQEGGLRRQARRRRAVRRQRGPLQPRRVRRGAQEGLMRGVFRSPALAGSRVSSALAGRCARGR